MNLEHVWTPWFSTVAATTVVSVVLIAVGTSFALAVGVRGLDALLLSPALGVGLLLCSGALLGRVGWVWSWWSGGLTVLLITALAGGFAALVTGSSGRVHLVRQPSTPARGSLWALGLGLLTAAIIVIATLATAIPSPGAVAPGPDTIFHLGSAIWQADHSSADVLSVGDFPWTDPSPYPGGFQALLATLVGWTSIPVTNASLIALLVVAGCVLPWGSVALARAAFGNQSIVQWTAPVVAVSIPVLTYKQLAVGPTWSSLTSLALVPSLLAACLAASAPYGSRPRMLARSALLALVLALAVAASQPSGLFAASILILPMMLASTSPLVRILGAGAAVCLGIVWAMLAPSSMLDIDVSGPTILREGVLIALKADYAPLHWASVLLLLLLLLGLAASTRHRDRSWVALGWSLLAVIWLSPAFVPVEWLPRLLWPWWNSSHRVLAALAIPATILITLGALTATRLVSRVARVGRATSHVVAAGLALGILACAVGHAGANAPLVGAAYDPPSEQSLWVTQDELDALAVLAEDVEPGSVVAANPFRGGSFMYVTSNRLMLFPTEKAFDTPGPTVLAERLDRVGTDSEACRWAGVYNVRYVLTGGTAPPGNETADAAFPGVDLVSEASGFRLVRSAGPYDLYRVPDCQSA